MLPLVATSSLEAVAVALAQLHSLAATAELCLSKDALAAQITVVAAVSVVLFPTRQVKVLTSSLLPRAQLVAQVK
jgi:hypothetical protein